MCSKGFSQLRVFDKIFNFSIFSIKVLMSFRCLGLHFVHRTLASINLSNDALIILVFLTFEANVPVMFGCNKLFTTKLKGSPSPIKSGCCQAVLFIQDMMALPKFGK